MNTIVKSSLNTPCQQTKMQNIELLRFCLAWVIVVGHIVNYTTLFGFERWAGYFRNFATSVEMFFVISFFFLTLKQKREESIVEFGIQKWLRLVPLIIVITGIGYIMHFFGFGVWSTSANLGNILLLNGWIEYTVPGPFVPQAWYCSVFFGVALFYLGIIKAFPKKQVSIVVAVLCFIGARYMSVSVSHTLLYSGVCRALFALGIGYFLACMYQTYNMKVASKKKKFLYTIVECVMAVLITRYLVMGMTEVLSTIHVVLAFSCLFWLFINKAGYISLFFEKQWCVFLGRYSYSLFIVHMFVCQVFMSLIRRGYGDWCIDNPYLLFLLMVVSSAILAIVGHHFIEMPVLRYARHLRKNKHVGY